MAERRRDRSAGRRKWGYGLVDLLVIGACSLVFVAIVTAGKATTKRPPLDERSREAGSAPTGLHHPASHEGARSGAFSWTPSRPR